MNADPWRPNTQPKKSRWQRAGEIRNDDHDAVVNVKKQRVVWWLRAWRFAKG
jgi:hypothetical protein